jgi:hypothetical protein
MAWEEANTLAGYAAEVGRREGARLDLTIYATGLGIRAEVAEGRSFERTGVFLTFGELEADDGRAAQALDAVVAELKGKLALSAP